MADAPTHRSVEQQAASPPGAHPARVVETHISRLFFVDEQVIKVKLPVTTPFVDLSTPALRRAACQREVELNRRLAPDVYRGVLDVSMGGDAVEHAVLMRRLPEDRRLSRRLDHPAVVEDLGRVAEAVVALHRRSRRGADIDAAATAEAVLRLWSEGVEQLAPFADTVLPRGEIDRLAMLASEYVAGRAALFEERIARGAAVDGHGDLQAEDIFCLDDGPRILDCLEFADRFRHGDALNDVAFLAMDLGRLGHPELGERFLAQYGAASGDDWPDSLARHYMAYRAHVRSKIAGIRHHQHRRPEDAELARDLHRRAIELLEHARVRLVLVGGSPGTGKSTLARTLAHQLGARRWATDEVRDELFPVPGRHPVDGTPTEAPTLGTGRYTPDRVHSVYEELARRAETSLARGHHVVLDASWLDPDRRDAARALADRTGALLVELRCTCSAEVAAARIRRRSEAGIDPSEATVEVGRALAAGAPSWPTAHEIDTEVEPHDAASRAVAAVSRAART